MKKSTDKIKNFKEMATDDSKRNEFNNEMVRKTWEYQKKFGFETSPRQGHEFWNNEADAFKHAFGSADMVLNMGYLGSLIGGLHHEFKTKNNPYGEWDMDSWNNNEGRKIADEIKKEYGKNFDKLSDKEKDVVIATKVIMKMRNGELITHPSDERKFKGVLETLFYRLTNKPTGFAAPISRINEHIFTPQEIGNMKPDELYRNLPIIEQQLKDGLIKPKAHQVDYSGYVNPVTGDGKIFSREAISQMTGDEYTGNESAIMAQLKSIGIPYDSDLELASMRGGLVYVRPYTREDCTEVRGYWRSAPTV